MSEWQPIETGGPAFPVDEAHSNYEGMTLRDYFAAKAMQAFISNTRLILAGKTKLANDSYSVADAMLEARK